MEKHVCKLCSRTFANGRALGGHMRSHVTSLSASLHKRPSNGDDAAVAAAAEARNEFSTSSSSSSEAEEEEEKKAQALCYGLRENPRKSFRLVDPEFAFAIDAGSVVQDRESETESSKNPHRRRSKRHRRTPPAPAQQQQKQMQGVAEAEAEPVSSVSDTTPEEDVALCLMMLSRDIWMRSDRRKAHHQSESNCRDDNDDDNDVYGDEGDADLRRRANDDDEEEEEEEEEEEAEEEKMKFCPRGRNKYQCGTCKKVFRSYQALGGHRASHKKIKTCVPPPPPPQPAGRSAASDPEPLNAASGDCRRDHECPVCFRVFKSGQALGGHKRSHLAAPATASASTSTTPPTTSAKFVFGGDGGGDSLIDLNLPAPMEDDDFSQVELSAVSDAEFIDPPSK